MLRLKKSNFKQKKLNYDLFISLPDTDYYKSEAKPKLIKISVKIIQNFKSVIFLYIILIMPVIESGSGMVS